MKHKHNLNHYKICSGRFGELLPVSTMEVLPGDGFRMRSTALVRLSPLVAPVMHPIHVRLHAFFVPNRLVWNDWEDFIVDMNTELTVPSLNWSNVREGDAMDYLGIPPGDYTNNPFNALPLRGYNLIWNEFYRDQDLDAPSDISNGAVKKVRWGKDYFTTARPEAQQGASETVTIEFDQDVPLRGFGATPAAQMDLTRNEVIESDGETYDYGVTAGDPTANWAIETDGSIPNIRIPAGAAAGSMDIQEWRRAMAFQRLSEHRNKYGSRYTDYLRFLGVQSRDSRLQRPEYIGGGSATVQVSEVLSTADTKNDVQQGSELGTLAGHGIAGHRTKPMRYFATEHGYIHILASIRPRSIYSNAVHRTMYRSKPADYWQKEMEIMGDQPVLTGEIKGNGTDPRSIFGYVDRHKDYREQFSGVAGEMRELLDYWHLGREFDEDPQLNSSFVECAPTERVFADATSDTFQLMVDHKVTARRLVARRARI